MGVGSGSGGRFSNSDRFDLSVCPSRFMALQSRAEGPTSKYRWGQKGVFLLRTPGPRGPGRGYAAPPGLVMWVNGESFTRPTSWHGRPARAEPRRMSLLLNPPVAMALFRPEGPTLPPPVAAATGLAPKPLSTSPFSGFQGNIHKHSLYPRAMPRKIQAIAFHLSTSENAEEST